MKLVVIDGQGGGVGAALCKEIKKRLPTQIVTCVGVNAIATAAMLKAGANLGATGENAVRVQARDADIIMGPIGIVLKDALMGEVTGEVAALVGQSHAQKILIPVKRCQVTIAGMPDLPLAGAVECAVDEVERILGIR